MDGKPSQADDEPRDLIGCGCTPDFGDDLLTFQMLHFSEFRAYIWISRIVFMLRSSNIVSESYSIGLL